MKIMTLFLSIMTLSAFANANICDPSWLATASGADVRAFLNAGVDANQVCNLIRNRPLHQALLADRVDPSVIEAFVSGGADISILNNEGDTPLDYAKLRFERAERNFRRGSAQYQRENAIYMNINRGFEVAGGEVAAAYDQLCDLNWWERSASGPAVQALLRVPGVDPNYVCNYSNDRPIHLPLKLRSFTLLPEGVARGIDALVDGGADLNARNNSGDSAVRLAGMRYDRVTDRITQHTIRWCRGGFTNQQFANEITRNNYDVHAYLYITSSFTRQPFNQVNNEHSMELYRTPVDGRITKRVLCPYRGVRANN